MEKLKITAIVKTHNCEKTICDTLESINILDEIIALDENSKDDTIEFLKEYKAKIIYSNKDELNKNYFSAIEEAKNDWIILLEDNEIIPKKTLVEINNYILQNNKKKCFSIALDRKTFYLNKELKCDRKKHVLTAFKKGYVEIDNKLPFLLKPHKTKTFYLKNNYILKYDKYSISEKIINSIQINKLKLKTENFKTSSFFLKPLINFIYFYFIKGAILEGKRGIIYAINSAFNSYILEMMIFEKYFKGENNDL